MLTELKMMPAIGRSGNNGVDGGLNNGDDMENDLGIILRQQDGDDRERDLNIFRSGSAPPSVEGSLSAVGGLFFDDSPSFNGLSEFRNCNGNGNGNLSEDDLRSDPAYHAYYYSNANLNPRLPPPGLSKEDWRFAQRLQGGNSVLGGIGDKRRGNNRMPEDGSNSQYAYQCVPNNSRHNLAGSSEWLNREADGLIGLSGLAIGSRPKDESGRPFTGHSRPSSRNTFEDNLEALANLDISSGNGNRVSSVPPIGPSATQTFASVLGGGSLSRSTTPDPQLVARVPSPGLPPVGVRINSMDIMGNNGSNGTFNNFSASNQDSSSDISTVFSGMNHMPRTSLTDEDYHQSHSRIKKELEDQSYYLERHGRQKHQSLMKNDQDNLGGIAGHNGNLNLLSQGQYNHQRNIVSSSNSYLKAPSGSSGGSPRVSSSQFNNYDGLNASSYGGYGHNVYPGSPVHPSMLANHMAATNLPPLFQNAAAASMASLNLDSRTLGGSSAAELQNLSRIANQAAAAGIQMPLVDPVFDQYMRTPEYASQFSSNPNDPSIDRSYLIGLQKAYIDALLSAQNNPNLSYLSKSGNFNPGYYNDPSFGLGMSYPGSPLSNSVHNASVGPGSPMRHSDHGMRVPSVMRNLNGGLIGSWTSEAGIHNMDESFASSLLEEFKSNKTKCFELSEIAGHVVEFSADQYGSRFIQQKLEAATIEEKNMVFEEIFPEILSLMTDVFGNYVIQKFFEHGTGSQRKQLADGLKGHVLALSLQMYGCRVIQKAIEVVNLDEQTNMVAELDGHIMRCVRDQNGNHVIQKCIECIPQESIVFIISSFYDKVVTLSTHPYGCRVIQRVLEHCDDPKTQKIVMDEIMQSVCMLAQDQYGNYVVQHVLGNGKPHERSAIITQLAGQIVQMSQQKFASNVVEKCLAYGGPAERQILVNEMLGTTDENEPLQAMMKDQFANYVVQKVLETCDDQQREHILSRIKVHLNALKKYTYGKHIVARVEKLVAAGERRGGLQSSYSSST